MTAPNFTRPRQSLPNSPLLDVVDGGLLDAVVSRDGRSSPRIKPDTLNLVGRKHSRPASGDSFRREAAEVGPVQLLVRRILLRCGPPDMQRVYASAGALAAVVGCVVFRGRGRTVHLDTRGPTGRHHQTLVVDSTVPVLVSPERPDEAFFSTELQHDGAKMRLLDAFFGLAKSAMRLAPLLIVTLAHASCVASLAAFRLTAYRGGSHHRSFHDRSWSEAARSRTPLRLRSFYPAPATLASGEF